MPNSTAALHERAARLAADPTLRPHGRENTYSNWGCRCPRCTTAHTEYAKARRDTMLAEDFREPALYDRNERREKLRAMGFEVNEATDDVI